MGCNQSATRKPQPCARSILPEVFPRADSLVIAPKEKNVEADSDVQQRSVGTLRGPGSKYKLTGPTADGESFPFFENGMLFRIVNEDQWFLYNDTQDYEMHVLWKFGPRSCVTGMSKNVFVDRENDGWITVKCVVYPGDTTPFVCGSIDGYKSSVSAKPLSQEYVKKLKADADAVVDEEIERVQSLVAGEKTPENVVQACVANNVLFVDFQFLPKPISLHKNRERWHMDDTPWKRPRQYLPPTAMPRLSNVIEPNDIDQGRLGDCWFLCSVASLAEFPSAISCLFRHPTGDSQIAAAENRVGAYHVTFNKGGWWRTIVVDDFIPVIGTRPCFAHNVEDPQELWVQILEKAYAKTHGSYASIVSGDAMQALQDLTGCPHNRFDSEWKDATRNPADADALFADLLRYDAEGCLINVNTPGKDTASYAPGASNSKEFQAKYESAGLGMGHAYSVLKVKHFPQYNDLKLLQIRNPWGNGTEWTGAFGDGDERWGEMPELRSACGFTSVPDGTFWMQWEDVLQYFDGGGCCFFRPRWTDYRVRGKFFGENPSVVLQITAKKRINTFLVLSQNDRRGAEVEADMQYAAILLTVFKPDGSGNYVMEAVSSMDAEKPDKKYCFCYARDVALAFTFEASEAPYFVVPRVFSAKRPKDFVLGLLAEQPVSSDGGFVVDFKNLSADCEIFKDYLAVAPPTAAACTTEYQVKQDGVVYQALTGNCIECGITPRQPGNAVSRSIPSEEQQTQQQPSQQQPQQQQPSQQQPQPQQQQQPQPQSQTAQTGPAGETDAKAPPEGLPEGDWEFQSDSGYYWSESNYLYYCIETQEFYDPDSGLWYDPATDKWYDRG